MPRTNFDVRTHGFHFSNRFVNHVIRIPLIGVDLTTKGRCGGMAFASLDHYFARLPISPLSSADFPHTGVPPDGDPVADYIYGRLLNSFALNAGTFISWTQASDHQTQLRGPGVVRLTKTTEILKLRSKIDTGEPVALGLVRAGPDDTLLTKIGDNHQVVAYGYELSGSVIRIYVYDNNYPDEEIELSTDIADMQSYVMSTKDDPWRGLFVESYKREYPKLQSMRQNEWRWCHRCSGLFWANGRPLAGVCPAGGQHDRDRSADYTLAHNSPGIGKQNDWRWCHKCDGLFWAGGQDASGTCPAQGQHDRGRSGDYAIFHNSPSAGTQDDWRWCHKCGGLFWSGGDPAAGACPAGGAHDRGQSGDYSIEHEPHP